MNGIQSGINLHKVEFISSAARREDLRHDALPQIAFAGKSNVGKSSVINRVLQRKNFARVGEQPGKTAHVNYFLVDGQVYFVDLPGYGYAKVSKAEKDRWAQLVEGYFAQPEQLTLGVMIVDSRHQPTQNDEIMANWFQQSGCPFVVVANKLDKLKKSQVESNLQDIRDTLRLSKQTRLIPFSAENGTGREELVRILLDAAAQ